MSETSDYTQEPKKVFLSFLIDRMKVANYFIFIMGQDTRGWDILDGVILSLSEQSQKALEPQAKKLQKAIYEKCRTCSRETRKIYGEVYAFLNKYYFEECNFSLIPTSALQGPTEAPTETINRREKANI